MRLPRKGLLIRLLIYIPLLGFFGWQALDRYRDQRDADTERDHRNRAIEDVLHQQTRSITLPDGTVQEVPVITPEQAKELWGLEVPQDPARPATDAAKDSAKDASQNGSR